MRVGRKMKNKKRLENKVKISIMKVRPSKDENGRYISFCDFGFHQGVLRNPTICEERRCYHYKKLYIK